MKKLKKYNKFKKVKSNLLDWKNTKKIISKIIKKKIKKKEKKYSSNKLVPLLKNI